jgi:hypothetical protein
VELTEQRRAENFAISCPLQYIEDPDMLAFLATLIQDHEHMREKLETEPDWDKKRDKLEAMRPHLRFRALPISVYIANSAAKQCGVQPVYQEQAQAEQSYAPPSRIHEVN